METIELQAQTAAIGSGDYVITAAGEVDMHSAPRLEALLQDLFGLEARSIVIDVRALTFVDSAGLGIVTSAVERARLRQACIVLVADSREVVSLFHGTGLERLLTVRPTLTSAIDEIRGRTA